MKDDSIGKNIEIGIYNYCINDANSSGIIKKWKNIKFSEIYSCDVSLEIENKSHLMTFIKKIYD